MKRLIVAITGASGVVYGIRLLKILAHQKEFEVHLTISRSGATALWEELQIRVDLDNFGFASLTGFDSETVVYHRESDIAAPIASGFLSHTRHDNCPVQYGNVGVDRRRHFAQPHSSCR